MIHILLIFSLIGCLAGFLGGFFGIGGTIFVVPTLLITLKMHGFQLKELMQIAITTSLASMLFNSFNSVLCHRKYKNIVWEKVKEAFFPLLVGCVLGSFIGHSLPTTTLTTLFAVVTFLLGLHFLFGKKKTKPQTLTPSSLFFKLTATSIATLANILGIGGGLMTVPFLSKFYMPIKKAIGTSAVLTFLTTFFGAISYFSFGLSSEKIKEPYTIGFIYLPAFFAITVSSFFTTRYGSLLSTILAKEKIEKFFGGFLIIISILMLVIHFLLRDNFLENTPPV